MYYRNKSKNNNNTLITRHAVICTTCIIEIFLDAERNISLEEPMATDTGNDIESFVQEVRMPFVGSREYYLRRSHHSR